MGCSEEVFSTAYVSLAIQNILTSITVQTQMAYALTGGLFFAQTVTLI